MSELKETRPWVLDLAPSIVSAPRSVREPRVLAPDPLPPAEPAPAGVQPFPSTAPVVASPLPGWLARHRLSAELGLVTFVALGVSAAVRTPPVLAGLLLLVSLVVAYRAHRVLARRGFPRALGLLGELVQAYAAIGLAVAVGLAQPAVLVASAWTIGTAGVCIGVMSFVGRAVGGPLRVLVVGDRSAITRAAMRWGGSSKVEVVGAVLTDPMAPGALPPVTLCGVPTAGGMDDVAHWAEVWRADLVVATPGSGANGEDLRRLSWLLEDTGVGLAMVGSLDGVAPHRIEPAHYEGATFVHLLPSRPSRPVQLAKATLDRLLGLVLLACSAPLIAALIILVRLDSRGAGLFRQMRVGQDGRPFILYKLRTMNVHAERDRDALIELNEGAGPLFKLHHDPRVTRVGTWLRRTSLDELPQLLNVVRGEMSLVGPRPALPIEVAGYDEVERRRIAVRPGMTGLWQVSGRSNLNWETSMALDLHYVDNWRPADDVLICARTFAAVVRARGAY